MGLLRVICCILVNFRLFSRLLSKYYVVVPDRIAQTQNTGFSLGRSSCLSPNRSGAESVIRTTIRFVLGTTWCFEATCQTDGGFTLLDGRRFHTTRRTEVSHGQTDGGFIRLEGRDGGSSSIMCRYMLGQQRTLRGDWWSVPRFQLRDFRRSTFNEVFRQKRAQRPERGRVRVSRCILYQLVILICSIADRFVLWRLKLMVVNCRATA